MAHQFLEPLKGPPSNLAEPTLRFRGGGSWAILVLDWRGGSQRVRHKADYAVGVLQRKWGRSTGTRLLEALEEWALAEGVRRLELGVMADSVRAITLYEKQGYVPEDLKRGVIMIDRQPVDEVVMGKLLS